MHRSPVLPHLDRLVIIHAFYPGECQPIGREVRDNQNIFTFISLVHVVHELHHAVFHFLHGFSSFECESKIVVGVDSIARGIVFLVTLAIVRPEATLANALVLDQFDSLEPL